MRRQSKSGSGAFEARRAVAMASATVRLGQLRDNGPGEIVDILVREAGDVEAAAVGHIDAVAGAKLDDRLRRERQHREHAVLLVDIGEARIEGGEPGAKAADAGQHHLPRSEEHTSELQSLMRISYD